MPVLTLYHSNFAASTATASIGDVGFGKLEANNHGAMLSEQIPPYAVTTWGWNVGTLAAPRCNQMDFGAEVSRTATTPPWQTTSRPALRPPSSSFGDSWVYGPLEGEFDPTPWYVTQSVKSTTLGSTQLGRFIWVFYRADTAQGSGSVVLSASYINSASAAVTDSLVYSSICTSLASTANRSRCTQSFTLGKQYFRRQFLIVQTYWNITTAGGGNNADVDWVIGPESSSIHTPNFEPIQMKALVHNSDDMG